MYHSTDSKNVGSIQQDGLAVGRESSHTLGGSWADSYYGIRPIYLSVEKGKYAGTPLTVDTSGLALVADLPSLVDTGAYQGEEGMYWDEGSEPAQMRDIVDEDGMVYFDDLLSPGSAASEAAIEITGTAAVLENIPPNRIQLIEGRHMRITKQQLMKITKQQLRRIVREAARPEINENVFDYPFQPEDIRADMRVGRAIGDLYTAVLSVLEGQAASDVTSEEIAQEVSDMVYEAMLQSLSEDWAAG